ncbi:MAG TPA: hypothetical protein VNI77_05805 [Nitrososphaera sp.]|nr:hypothetical protein [Nitrososphaera sp.]
MYNTRTAKLAGISVVAAFAVMLIAPQAAYAGPYIGGYRDSSTVHQPSQFTGFVTFDGTTSVSSFTGAVVSMAGWGSTAPTKMVYQAPTLVDTDDVMYGAPQVWTADTGIEWYDELPIGTHGSNDEDVDYVYYTLAWNGARTQVTFCYEAHTNDGTVFWDSTTYSKISGDTSTNFAAGWEDRTIGSTSYRFKYLQFGVESGSSTSGWVARQYDMTYYHSGGAVELEDVIGRSLVRDTSSTTYESWITYTGTNVARVGTSNYVANADYNLKSGSSLSDGEVEWYKDNSSLAAGTRLW